MPVYLDGKKIRKIADGSFIYIPVKPGNYSIGTPIDTIFNSSLIVQPVTISKNTKAFIKATWSTVGTQGRLVNGTYIAIPGKKWTFSEMPPYKALQELTNLRENID